MSSLHSIAVIGGGAAGTAFLAAYARELSADSTALPADVYVFEPTERFGPGVAYARDTLAALLNRPMSAMSVDHNDPGHFRRWLSRSASRRHTAVLPTPREAMPVFAPRVAFGNYLEGVFRHACDDLEHLGARVTTVRDAVTELTEEHGVYTVSTAGGGRFTTGSVVLAVGSLPPADLFGLSGAPGFVAQPYPLARSLQSVDGADEVLVLGCGLTAIDCALVLSEQGRRVTLASRSGFVPDVRAEATARWDDTEHAFGAHSMASSGSVRLADVYSLIDTHLRDRGTSLRHAIRPYAERRPVADLLRSRLADLGPVGLLQRCVTGMTPAYSALWRALPPEDQQTFLRRHNRVFSCVRNPMPPENARKLIRLADAGSLDFRRGITGVREEAGGGFTAAFADGSSTRYDRVVNAVGRTIDITTAPEGSLLRALSRRSLLAPHPAGGVRVEPATNRALRPDSSPRTGFYVVGDLSSGVHFHSSSMEYVARQAARVARHTVNASGRYELQAV